MSDLASDDQQSAYAHCSEEEGHQIGPIKTGR